MLTDQDASLVSVTAFLYFIMSIGVLVGSFLVYCFTLIWKDGWTSGRMFVGNWAQSMYLTEGRHVGACFVYITLRSLSRPGLGAVEG